MKQHITVEQLNELSEKKKKMLRKWWKTQSGDVGVYQDERTRKEFVIGYPVENLIEDEEKTQDEKSLMRFCLTKLAPNVSPLFSVGQMIDFLNEHLKTDWSICSGKDLLFWGRSDGDGIFGKTPENRKGELCDALWKAVKEVLEK